MEDGLLPGIIRQVLLEQVPEIREASLTPEDLASAEEVFVTNSVLGIMPVCRYEDHMFKENPITRKLMKRLETL